MTIIAFPPDLERRLAGEAACLGTTPELSAINGLRRLFASRSNEAADAKTLFDFLAGHVGAVAGIAELLSEECGR
jgi:hypothetical protein